MCNIAISLSKFSQFENWCIGRIHYQMGAKCSNLGKFPPTFDLNGQPCMGVDCSGFVRAILDYATIGSFAIPDGSFVQDEWLKTQGFPSVPYDDCSCDDNYVRIAIHRPGGRSGDPTGHIWLCTHAHTVESYGGHGPGNRPWDTPLLVSLVDDCYRLGQFV
jgi:hypothetical protein